MEKAQHGAFAISGVTSVAEVATVTLDDIDWRLGEMLIRAKGLRRVPMPVPLDDEAAVVIYLRESCLRSSRRRLQLADNECGWKTACHPFLTLCCE